MSLSDDYFTLPEACQESGLTELEVFERFVTGELKPSVFFLAQAPVKLVSKGKDNRVSPDVWYIKGLWDMTSGNRGWLVNGSRSLVEARRDALRHQTSVTPTPAGYIFLQQDRRAADEATQLHKVDFCRLLDEQKLAEGEEHPALDLPPDSRIVIRKVELLAFLDKRCGELPAGAVADAPIGTHRSPMGTVEDAWKAEARTTAARLIKEASAADRYPSQMDVAEIVAADFRARRPPVHGAGGKPLSAATIKRHALAGISSETNKSRATRINRGK